MTLATKSSGKTEKRRAMGLFERYLTLWVALCIVAGITLGHFWPAPFQAIGPLVEWRKGDTGGLGASDRVQTLNWF